MRAGTSSRTIESSPSAIATMTFDTTQLANQVLVDADGAEQRLGDLWAEHPQVLLFLRHFG